ncbi:MAG: murein biosynthesis integral membrane protein MurJ [Verrucomicrobia bacterium]|nr:murein biosynthesis integral membrane protein MurJ [Verrucomicrobiota bacterium]
MNEPVGPAPTDAAKERVGARTFGIVTLAILSSRVLGLAREMFLAYLYGGEKRKWFDCFIAAFRLPNMLRDLFAEGALSTAFVTTFSKRAQTEGDQSAWTLASKMLTLATVAMSAISILGIVFARPITKLMAMGWVDAAPDKIEFTIELARIMYPFILLVSLAALVMGMLNAKKVFGMPAMASTFFNIFSIIGGGLIGWWMDPAFGKTSLIGFAIGTLIGGLAQLGVQLPSLRRAGYRFYLDFNWRDSGVRKVLQLMWPAVLSGSVVQVNVLMNSIFASYLTVKDGPVMWLNNSFRLIQLPLGLFGVAVATITLPAMSRLATEGITEDFKQTLARGLKLVFLMTLPSAVGMALLAEPIISIIYQRGRFSAEDTAMTALALRSYAWGLVFYSGIKVLQPAFYAIERRYIPLLVSIAAVIVSVGLNYLTVYRWKLGHEYLALGTSLSAIVNFTLLFLAMRTVARGIRGHELGRNFLKLGVSCAAMAAVCWAGQLTILHNFSQQHLLQKILTLGVTISLAAGVYFLANALLRNEEVGDMRRLVMRKLGRGKRA